MALIMSIFHVFVHQKYDSLCFCVSVVNVMTGKACWTRAGIKVKMSATKTSIAWTSTIIDPVVLLGLAVLTIQKGQVSGTKLHSFLLNLEITSWSIDSVH